MTRISRSAYAEIYGPTVVGGVGDRVRLADTLLLAEVEKDHTIFGEEVKFGGGKVIRDGMGQSQRLATDCVDTVITNALIIDAVTGIVKADIGIKDGLISGIGKAGNPDTQPGVTIIIGASTEVVAGEGLIVTAGAIDTHIHFICPQQIEEALATGTTTMIGGGTGPATGSLATTSTSGPWHMAAMLQALDAFPVNVGLFGKGSSSSHGALLEQVRAGAMGLKIHEDWASTPASIDTCLNVAEETDIQVAIHSDTLNESGFVEDTFAAFKGRTIHSFHTEGAGGGHAPDIIRRRHAQRAAGLDQPDHAVHAQHDRRAPGHGHGVPSPGSIHRRGPGFRRKPDPARDHRGRGHPARPGAFSIMSSDSQAMGRVGEIVLRTWQTAHKMKLQRGPLQGDSERSDNERIKRYIAKYTINPAVAHGIAHLVGSVEVGKLADLVLWKPAFFGVKVNMVLKSGMAVSASIGDMGASISTPQPVQIRPMWGSHGKALRTSVAFVSQVSLSNPAVSELGLNKRLEAVRGCRGVTKHDMVRNNWLPAISVDPQTYQVYADGQLLRCEALAELPMAQRYFLF